MSIKYMTKEEVRANTQNRLVEMRTAGIEFVEVLESGLPRKTCPAARSLKNQKIPIDSAAPLPLGDCDKDHCLCIYMAKS